MIPNPQRGTIRKNLLAAISVKYNWLIGMLVFSAFFLVFLDPKGVVIALAVLCVAAGIRLLYRIARANERQVELLEERNALEQMTALRQGIAPMTEEFGRKPGASA